MSKHRPTLEDLQQMDNDYSGFCTSCGEIQESCEPDARAYECESCGAHTVHGTLGFLGLA